MQYHAHAKPLDVPPAKHIHQVRSTERSAQPVPAGR
jgi:hypothetical protein